MSQELRITTMAEPETEAFSAGDFIREIGRGRDGARNLGYERARTLFDEIFAEGLSELELGAVLIAFRMKGESADEVAAGLAALERWIHKLPVDPLRPVVSIPSYNGSRNVANLTPLLACMLADSGVQVIVHGVRSDPKRVTTFQVMQAMGIDPAHCVDDVPGLLERNLPAFVPIDVLSPRLSRLLDLRWRLGVRNTGHTLAKLLNPVADPQALLLTSYTHPEFELLQHELMLRLRCNALISRGTEGEVVANARRYGRIDWLHDGQSVTLLEAQPLPISDTMPLPPGSDVVACAGWIQSVLAGERQAPLALQAQFACVRRALGLQAVA